MSLCRKTETLVLLCYINVTVQGDRETLELLCYVDVTVQGDRATLVHGDLLHPALVKSELLCYIDVTVQERQRDVSSW